MLFRSWAFGYLAELTGNWHVPFIGSLGMLVLGAALSFSMHVERPFEESATAGTHHLAPTT